MAFKSLGFLVAGAFALCTACGDSAMEKPAEHPVVRMAPFDLDCPKDQLHYTRIDSDTWGVTGCGKRAKYIKACRQKSYGAFTSDECRWIQN